MTLSISVDPSCQLALIACLRCFARCGRSLRNHASELEKENARCAGGEGGQLERNASESGSALIIQQNERPAGEASSTEN